MIASRDISASLVLHVTLAVVVGFWTPVMTTLDTNDTLLPVEIVTVEEFTRLTRDKPKKEILEKEPAPAKPAPPVARETAPPEPAPAEAMPLPEPVREKPPVADTFTGPVESTRRNQPHTPVAARGAARTAQAQTGAGCVANTRFAQ